AGGEAEQRYRRQGCEDQFHDCLLEIPTKFAPSCDAHRGNGSVSNSFRHVAFRPVTSLGIAGFARFTTSDCGHSPSSCRASPPKSHCEQTVLGSTRLSSSCHRRRTVAGNTEPTGRHEPVKVLL